MGDYLNITNDSDTMNDYLGWADSHWARAITGIFTWAALFVTCHQVGVNRRHFEISTGDLCPRLCHCVQYCGYNVLSVM